jgi:hypothetical protein
MARPKSDGGNGKRVNKMNLVREALSTLGNDAMPGAIADHIKDKYGETMTPNMVSNYKSSILKKMGLSPRRRRRRRARAASAEARPTAAASGDSIASLMKDIRALHDIAGRRGLSRLRELRRCRPGGRGVWPGRHLLSGQVSVF